jgi:acyl-CoA synthetase (AMP-forming)/AMP-acid ligase II
VTTFLGPPPEQEAGIGALTMGGLLETVAAHHAERDAIAFHGVVGPDVEGDDGVIRWTYRDLLDESRRVARALLAHGVVKGTRVAVLMGNRPEFVSATFGIALVGGVLVPISTFIEPPELDYVLRHSDASVLLMQEQLLAHRYVDALVEVCPEIVDAAPGALRTPRLPFLRTVAVLGLDAPAGAILPMEPFLARAEETPDELLDACTAEVTPADDAVIIYTSGTTARPKGVLHAQRAPALQSWRLAQHLCLDPDVRVWTGFPFFWTAGLTMAMGATLAAGGCLVLQEGTDGGETLRLLEAERVTTPLAKAHTFAELEDHPDWLDRDLSALRHVEAFTSFGRHPTVHVDDVWSNRAGYGLTETMSNLASAPADTPADLRTGNYGWILPGNAVRILDPSTGEALGVDEEGEITVKGLTLCKGYVKTAPEEVFDAEGFFHTGDGGFVDELGRLHFTGRASAMIKTGGANVSPIEIEQELLRHPEIRMVWIVGVPDAARGELVVACVVPLAGAALDEDDVRAFLKGKLASYKIPKRAFFFAEDELEMTANNAKPRAEVLRTLVEQRMAGSA